MPAVRWTKIVAVAIAQQLGAFHHASEPARVKQALLTLERLVLALSTHELALSTHELALSTHELASARVS